MKNVNINQGRIKLLNINKNYLILIALVLLLINIGQFIYVVGIQMKIKNPKYMVTSNYKEIKTEIIEKSGVRKTITQIEVTENEK